ncbi:MAG: hypothetical protein QOE23_1670 [Pseudonocardiales bacterium]|jgi:hypothetical protein|nr:hypothetical protein [Pseudonocardiales bacterium]
MSTDPGSTDPSVPDDDRNGLVQAVEQVVDRVDERVGATEDKNQILPDNTRMVRWAALLFLVCAAILLPWIVIAAVILPSHQLSENYDVAWAGYDVGLFIGLVSTAVLTLRRSARLPIAAAATGALLAADAWFDVLTSPGGWDLAEAVAMSVLAELPLAGVCVWLAFHSQEVVEQRLLLLSGQRRGSRRGRRG